MARPTNKDDLLIQSEENYRKLFKLIDGLSEEKREADFPEGTLNRNVRDVLGHLHHWHGLMGNWYQTGMSGQKPAMPAPGYTWKTVPALNRWIQQQYTSVPLVEMRERLETSHVSTLELIIQHTDEELFTKKYYPWTGSTSLGAYLVSATSSHYDWAYKLIKRLTK